MNKIRALTFSMLALGVLTGLSGVGLLGADNAYACHKGEPHGAQDPCGTVVNPPSNGGDTEIEVRDFLNENNNECKDFADCVHQGSGDDEIDDINF